MRRSTTRLVNFLPLALAAVTCGGQAVIDHNDGGTSSTSSTSSTGSTTTTTTSPPLTAPPTGTLTYPGTGTNTGSGTLCQQACDAIGNCTAVTDCVSSCEYAPSACASQQDAWLSCFVNTNPPTGCALPPNCISALDSWINCVDPNPKTMGCSGGPGFSCWCQTGVANKAYEVFCDGAYPPLCQCLAGGINVGTCTEQYDYSCDPYSGCCATLFFVPY